MLHVVQTIVTDKRNNILVLRRTKSAPRRPLTWDFPGGLIEDNETPIETAFRETKEETGLNVENLHILEVVRLNNDQPVEVVFCKGESAHTEVRLSYEHDAYRWVTPADFNDINAPDLFKNVVLRKLQ